MADKSPAIKKSFAPARQQMLESLAQAEKQVKERREAAATPEDKLEAKALRESVAVAEGLFSNGVVKSITDLRSSVNKSLAQLSDRLEEEVAKYVQIQRAIMAKDQELQEIYEIQRSASTLVALIETQDRKRNEFEAEMQAKREELTQEIEMTRAEWERARNEHEDLRNEQEQNEQKRRQREKEEYQYAFARDQQQAREKFADEMTRARKESDERRAQAAKELSERERAMAGRERAMAAREQELATLRLRVEGLPKELDAAASKAGKEATERAMRDVATREELLNRQFAAEKNVLTSRIHALEPSKSRVTK
jgi:hypothetical protein